MCGSQGATLFGTTLLFFDCLQHGPKKAQHASKRAPRLSQEGPTGSHIGPKIASREHQEASKKEGSSPANRSWMGQDGPKTSQDESGCVYQYVYVYAYVYVYVSVFVYLSFTTWCSTSLLPTIRLSIGSSDDGDDDEDDDDDDDDEDDKDDENDGDVDGERLCVYVCV